MSSDEIIKEFIAHRTLSDKIRPKQLEAIEAALDNQNIIVVFPTGGGKSLCYQLPSLFFDSLTIVISPLVSLIHDQIKGLLDVGIPAANYYSESIKILYCTPESLLGKLGDTLISENVAISRVVFDEAHCIITWGNEFRSSYLNVCNVISKLDVPITVLSATLSNNQIRDISHLLNIQNPVIIKDKSVRTNLKINVIEKTKLNVTKEIIKLLSGKLGSAIVYCRGKKDCENLSAKLTSKGILSTVFHADIPNKKEVLDMFMNNQVRVVVATIAFGMGIDKSDVRIVIHKDMPRSIDSYYQEIGRAGRDGEEASCYCFYNFSDLYSNQDSLIMYNFCKNLQECRLKQLSVLLDLDTPKNCNHCDTCKFDFELIDVTSITSSILQILRFKSMNKSELNKKLDEKDIINELIRKNFLKETQILCKNGHYTTELSITEYGINNLDKPFFITQQTKRERTVKEIEIDPIILATIKALNPSTPELLTKIKGMPDEIDEYVKLVYAQFCTQT